MPPTTAGWLTPLRRVRSRLSPKAKDSTFCARGNQETARSVEYSSGTRRRRKTSLDHAPAVFLLSKLHENLRFTETWLSVIHVIRQKSKLRRQNGFLGTQPRATRYGNPSSESYARPAAHSASRSALNASRIRLWLSRSEMSACPSER
jgi:hypothetical protein